MAVLVLKDAYFAIGSVELSDHVKTVTLSYSAESLDKTAMTNETRAFTGGLFNWSVDLELYQDHASASVSDTLYPLVGSSTFTVTIRPTTAAAGSSNPGFSGTGYLESFLPIAGTVGEMAMTPVRILAAGNLTRTT